MIQLYVKISDLTPTEPKKFMYKRNGKGQVYFHDPDEKEFYNYDKRFVDCNAFLEDIKANGIKYALSVTSAGIIKDGNCRYWIAKKLGIEYLPINIIYFHDPVGKNLYPKKEVVKL